MAVSIMLVCCRAYVLYLYLLACFLQVHSHRVFHQAPQVHNMFLRSKRANMFLFEEILQGNLERECYEERCNFEEAREYFEDNKKTIAFWTVYVDGDQCKPNPCLHGGNCTDMVGGFQCSCHSPHHGSICELGALRDERREKNRPPSAPQSITPEISKCPTEGPAACQQLCTASYHSFTCSCMSGFKLQSDKRTCLPEVEFPCGRLPDNTSMCHHGNCPWQVSLLNSQGVELCGGVVLGRHSVLTAAHCLALDSGSDLRPSNFYVVTGNNEILIPVRALYIHDRFRTDHHDNDLALLELDGLLPFGPTLIQLCLPTKDFSENILMHSGRSGVVEQMGGGRNQDLLYMTLDDCRSQLNVSHPLSNKMFCMRKENGMTENENGTQERPHGPSGNRNGAQKRSHNRAQRLNSRLGNQNGAPRTLSEPLGNQNGAQGMMDGHIENRSQNQTQNIQMGAQGMPNGAENHNGSIHDPSEHGGRRCGGLLPGTPVATVEQGTAFLTGLMISSSGCDGGGGLVFTKLSRYLSWIRPRLEAAEANHMTPQVSEYPEHR